MANGRQVTHKVTYSNVPFNHTNSTVTYSDNTQETFGPTCNYIPDIGDIEDIDMFGNRVGWFGANGVYTTDGNLGSLGHWQRQHPVQMPIYPQQQPYIPHIPMNPDFLKYLGVPESKFACTKCKEMTNESELTRYNWSTKHEHKDLERKICKKCYTKAMDKFLDLDKSVETEEVLYGSKDDKRNDP